MVKKILLVLLSLIWLNVQAYKERNLLQNIADTNRLKTVLISGQKWVHYPAYTDRAGWDKLLQENKIQIIGQGEKFLDYKWKVVKATDYLEYSRSGNRSIMERTHNANLNAVSTLFIAEIAEGKGRFIDQLINGIFHICEMTTWCNSAHLPLQKVKGSFPDYRDPVIDLVSGDVGANFSWIYYFLGKEFDKINPLISERLYHEIDTRILTPYLKEDRFWWMATDVGSQGGFVNNWNPWCNANVLQCFLLVEKDPDRRLKGIYKTMVSVDKFINYNNEDGACEEGPSYWGHAAGKMYDYLQILYDATGGEISIFQNPIIKDMGEYILHSYAGNGWVVNFADALAKSDIDYRLTYRYGKMAHSTDLMHFAAYLKKELPKDIPFNRDMYRILEDLSFENEIVGMAPLHVFKPFVWYPETEFCYISNGKAFFSCKGGYNDESHNHNDTGTFSLYVDGTPVFIDAGVGTYTAKTFSKDRYSIWTMQSDYHNLPRINGYSQAYGKQYAACNVKADEKSKTFSLDISRSYPAEAGVNSWIREYRLKKDALIIEDKFDLKQAKTANRLNFLTWGKADLTKAGIITVIINNETYQLEYNKADFDIDIEVIKLDDKRLSDVWGNEIYRISLNARKIKNNGLYRIKIKI
ncbi:MAG: heparinase II/III-family protein [Dysgonomonas sp.]|uniref:heparinase II/III family protein n=1 Tax=Dysgonomonas sp. TaxID=1891233 RepID=UPI003A89E488